MLSSIRHLVVGIAKFVTSCSYKLPMMLYHRRKGISIFQKQLRHSGLDEKTVQSLTQNYRRLTNIRSWLPNQK